MDNETQQLIAGALFDFLGFLTTREEPVTLGSSELTPPAIDLLSQWAATRGLELDEARVTDWHDVDRWKAGGVDYDRNIHTNPDAQAWANFLGIIYFNPLTLTRELTTISP